MGGESGLGTFRRSGPSHDQEVPSTPRTSTSLTPSGIVPPPFDLTELGTFAKGSQEVSAILSTVRSSYVIRSL
jgi:hypothetical protein